MPKQGFHESYAREEDVRGSSERGFGIVFGAVFLLVGFAPLLREPSGMPRLWAVGVAIVFFALAFLWTTPLRPLNRLWFRFGLLLHTVVSPVILGFVFYAVVTPIGLIMRLAGKDILKLSADPHAQSYWLRREPPGPAPETMKNQF